MNKIAIINGPNLNLLGTRQPEIYGYETLKDIQKSTVDHASGLNFKVEFMQSNHEGQIIDFIHNSREKTEAIIINPAAFSHTSVAILDALNAYEGLVVEVHLSNIHKRESFRHHSYVSSRDDGVISGMGSY